MLCKIEIFTGLWKHDENESQENTMNPTPESWIKSTRCLVIFKSKLGHKKKEENPS